jgi:hypothetical protein
MATGAGRRGGGVGFVVREAGAAGGARAALLRGRGDVERGAWRGGVGFVFALQTVREVAEVDKIA